MPSLAPRQGISGNPAETWRPTLAKIKIEISTDNAAFGDEPGHEAAKILHEIAEHIAAGIVPNHFFSAPIRDTNGNTVGKFHFIK